VSAVSDPLLIYGATGYSGRLITDGAVALGLRPVLAGRSEGKLAAMARPLHLDYRVAGLNEPQRLDAALRDIAVVLNAAGPFSQTSAPIVDACLRARSHYLDITGEIPVIESLVRRDRDARTAGVMLMPAVGFDVVPSDCLAAHVARRLPGATALTFGLTGLVTATPGSAKTLVEHVGYGVKVRRAGIITSIAPGEVTRCFDFGSGPQPAMNISWGDVASAYYTTGIPNIDVFYEATPALQGMLLASRYAGWMLRTVAWQAGLKAYMDLLPEGPTVEQRAASRMVIVAEALDGRGRRASARLRTPEAYAFTGTTAAAVARNVLRGDLEIGFQTPGRVYGADFVLSFAAVSREDLE
jgi:short subunit dehydrogenase-like uncharacterized protein